MVSNQLTEKLESVRTKITQSDITIEVSNLEVTARAEHIPSI